MDMKKKNKTSAREKKNNLAPIILIASIFGLSTGLISSLLIGFYFFNSFKSSSESVVQYQQEDSAQTNSLIEKAKEIINEQDNKTREAADLAKNGLVGIFAKKDLSELSLDDEEFDINNYYRLNDNIGQGLVITSDGWILFLKQNGKKIKKENILNYVAISKDKKVYELDNYKESGIDSYAFLHLADIDNLPVKNFVLTNNLSVGQTILSVNWSGDVYTTTILNKKHSGAAVRSSDEPSLKIILSDDLGGDSGDAFVFDLNNGIAGIYTEDERFVSMDVIKPFINGFLSQKNIGRPSLGVYYSDLSEFAIRDTKYENGALLISAGENLGIKPESAADKAGLKEGDVIVSVDNVRVSEEIDLADLIKKYSAGDEVDVLYLRNGSEKIIKVKLEEFK